jgi:hypothetical protein
MNRQILILAHAGDQGAQLVAAQLAAHIGPEGVSVLRPEMLGVARWSHRVNRDGGTVTRIDLRSGVQLASGSIGAVLNRIRHLALPQFRNASPKDRDYANMELQAVVASWLTELGSRAVHSVRHHSSLSPAIPRLRWASAAARAGIRVARPSVDGTQARTEGTVLVAGQHTGGTLAHRFGAPCRAAADALGFTLLEFTFVGPDNASGEVALADVTPFPALVEEWAALMTARLLLSISGPRSGAQPRA